MTNWVDILLVIMGSMAILSLLFMFLSAIALLVLPPIFEGILIILTYVVMFFETVKRKIGNFNLVLD